DVVGFDILIKYDPEAFSFSSLSSLTSKYQVYKNLKDDYITMTGVQPPQNQERSLLNDTRLVELTVIPKKTGTYKFEIVPKFGKETTKFVDNKTKRYYPQTSDLTVNID